MILEARKAKTAKSRGVWMTCNRKKKRIAFFERLNTPIEMPPKP